MAKRQKMKKSMSKAVFTKYAQRTHRRNTQNAVPQRGGIIL